MLATPGHGGATQPFLIAHGFRRVLISGLVNRGLVIMARENIRAGGKMIQVTKVQITAAGREALPPKDEMPLKEYCGFVLWPLAEVSGSPRGAERRPIPSLSGNPYHRGVLFACSCASKCRRPALRLQPHETRPRDPLGNKIGRPETRKSQKANAASRFRSNSIAVRGLDPRLHRPRRKRDHQSAAVEHQRGDVKLRQLLTKARGRS
jgi:hypothetical protein